MTIGSWISTAAPSPEDQYITLFVASGPASDRPPSSIQDATSEVVVPLPRHRRHPATGALGLDARPPEERHGRR